MSDQVGVKHDAGKEPYHLLPLPAIRETVKVLQFGSKKYAAWNWAKGLNYSRVYDSLQRHLYAWWWDKEEVDSETGLSHLAHASCCILFLLFYALLPNKYKQFDDRPSIKDEILQEK